MPCCCRCTKFAFQQHNGTTDTHTHQRVGCSEFATTRHSHGLVGCTRRRLGMIAQHWKMVSTAWSCVTLTSIRVLTPLYGFRPARLRTCRRTAERDVAAIVSDRNLVTISAATCVCRQQCPFDKTTRQLMCVPKLQRNRQRVEYIVTVTTNGRGSFLEQMHGR